MPVTVMVLSIPFTLVVLGAVLAFSALAEQRVLSPRSMVIRVVRARRTSPDFVEAFVARECAPLLARRGS